YGASFGGIAALLGMLNSCANGVSVANIDHGFGAGCIASMSNHPYRETRRPGGTPRPRGFFFTFPTFATRTLEFDRIVADVAALSLTPLGRGRLEAVEPSTNPAEVAAEQQATSETVRFLEQNPAFPLKAGPGLTEALAALGIEGRPLDPL